MNLSYGTLDRPWFHRTMAGLCTLLVSGAYVDAWAHNHLGSTLETFFTPWHALLYSSMAAITVFLVLCAAWTGARPWEWGRALPDGYALSLAGCFAFGVGGILDLTWHLIFGIERSFQALISPTHLILMGSAALIVAGPLRWGWRSGGLRAGWPVVISATLLLAMLTFFGQFDHPFTSQWAAAPQPAVPTAMAEELGVLGVIFHTALSMTVALFLIRRFRLPLGSLTVLLGVTSLLVTLIHAFDPIFLIGVIGGVVGDVLLLTLRPSALRPLRARVLAVVVPVVIYALYFGALFTHDGVWWPVHLWTGAIVLAGVTGWLVSLVVMPSGHAAAAVVEEVDRPATAQSPATGRQSGLAMTDG
jgi:hypothetical protein